VPIQKLPFENHKLNFYVGKHIFELIFNAIHEVWWYDGGMHWCI